MALATNASTENHENHPLSSIVEHSSMKCEPVPILTKHSIEVPNFNLRLSDAELDIARKLSFSAALEDSAQKGAADPEEDVSRVPSNEKVQIVIRVRPIPTETDDPLESSQSSDASDCFRVTSNTTLIAQPPKTTTHSYRSTGAATSFQFSHIFQPWTAQENLFEATTKPVLKAAFRGHHGLVFAYGVTNSGKTYTITGTSSHPGIIPRALSFVVQEMHCRKENEEHPITSIMASYVEIYNDNVYDLLTTVASHKRRALRLQECDGRIQVRGMIEKSLNSLSDAEMLLSLGQKNKQMADTRCNHDSSRSHCIFTLSFYQSPSELGSKVSIVDLAGSERSGKTGARGLRMMETSKINSSLMHLMRCLEILRWNQSHPLSLHKMVPYRESKLTRLFQEHLNGRLHGPVVMIVAVNPSPNEFEETLRTLKYSAIAKELVTVEGIVGKCRLSGYDLDGRRTKRRRRSSRMVETEVGDASETTVEETFGRYMVKGGIVKPTKVPLRSVRSHSEGEAVVAERQKEMERELDELRGRVTLLEQTNQELETSKLALEQEKDELGVQLSQTNANQLGWELQLRAEIGQEMQRQLQEFKTKFRLQHESMVVLQQKLEVEQRKLEEEKVGRAEERNRLERLVQQLQEKLNESEDEIKRIEARQQKEQEQVTLSPKEITSGDVLSTQSRVLRRSERISK